MEFSADLKRKVAMAIAGASVLQISGWYNFASLHAMAPMALAIGLGYVAYLLFKNEV